MEKLYRERKQMNSVQWSDHFNIGVDIVDKAHQRLFSVVGKMIALNEDEEKRQHACRETIKYFKSYTEKHFAEEEEYMRSILYDKYAVHKSLHDDLRYKTLPALEAELEEQDYSEEALHHFLGICLGWLTGHIMLTDRAITGLISDRWVHNSEAKELTVLEEAIARITKEMMGISPRLVSEHYGGENFGKGIYIRQIYRSVAGERIQIFLIFEEQMILKIFGEVLGKKLPRVDRTVIYAVNQLAKMFVKRIRLQFENVGTYRLEKENVLSYEQLLKEFDRGPLYYSLLYDTGGKGYFAFSVIK